MTKPPPPSAGPEGQLKQHATKGDPEAQYTLGKQLAHDEDGQGRNTRAAAYWFLCAAAKNHPGALYELAKLYADGDGIPQDMAKALHCLRSSADKGHLTAQYELAVLYQDGYQNIPANPAKAYVYYSLALASGGLSSMTEGDVRESLESIVATLPDQLLEQAQNHYNTLLNAIKS